MSDTNNNNNNNNNEITVLLTAWPKTVVAKFTFAAGETRLVCEVVRLFLETVTLESGLGAFYQVDAPLSSLFCVEQFKMMLGDQVLEPMSELDFGAVQNASSGLVTLGYQEITSPVTEREMESISSMTMNSEVSRDKRKSTGDEVEEYEQAWPEADYMDLFPVMELDAAVAEEPELKRHCSEVTTREVIFIDLTGDSSEEEEKEQKEEDIFALLAGATTKARGAKLFVQKNHRLYPEEYVLIGRGFPAILTQELRKVAVHQELAGPNGLAVLKAHYPNMFWSMAYYYNSSGEHMRKALTSTLTTTKTTTTVDDIAVLVERVLSASYDDLVGNMQSFKPSRRNQGKATNGLTNLQDRQSCAMIERADRGDWQWKGDKIVVDYTYDNQRECVVVEGAKHNMHDLLIQVGTQCAGMTKCSLAFEWFLAEHELLFWNLLAVAEDDFPESRTANVLYCRALIFAMNTGMKALRI